MLDIKKVKKDFPILNQKMNDQRLVYLDNAATTQKPKMVIETITEFYEKYNANTHRGIYQLSEKATFLYEEAREKVRIFIGAEKTEEIIFTRGTTESINLVAYSWGRKNIEAGDEILLTEMEHHSNIVPWQLLAKEKGAILKFIPVDKEGKLNLDNIDQYFTKKTKLLALIHVSNVLGVVNPIKEIIAKAHMNNVPVLLDGAQSIPHMSVNVKEMDCDFFAFSGHKMLAPTGTGVLYAREDILEKMPPFQSGGSMIKEVTMENTQFEDLPIKFEAGTMPIAQVVGLGAAIDYLNSVGMEEIWKHEQEIVNYALNQVRTIDGVTVYGPKEKIERSGVVSFTIDGVHPHDIASILDEAGVAIRAGHHCAQPLLRALGTEATARASFYLYNDQKDVDQLVEAVNKAIKILK
ncbi:cysteine desulfurase [Patescibacteria group bacterium]|nr:cysteine desulfurase [Patescibacteria group bacterium]MBU1951561.1 cysteine desulfurase [Patescibacteria group bacterium]